MLDFRRSHRKSVQVGQGLPWRRQKRIHRGILRSFSGAITARISGSLLCAALRGRRAVDEGAERLENTVNDGASCCV